MLNGRPVFGSLVISCAAHAMAPQFGHGSLRRYSPGSPGLGDGAIGQGRKHLLQITAICMAIQPPVVFYHGHCPIVLSIMMPTGAVGIEKMVYVIWR